MRLGKLAVVLAVSLLLASVAAAQGPGGFGGFGGGLAAMVGQSKQLQDELKVDKDQVEKLNQALAKVRDDMKDEMAKLRDRNLSPEDRTEIFKKLNEANTKAVEAILKPDQVKRLHQIENQQAGIGMFDKEEVQKTLKLSDSQKEKIKGINTDLQKDMRDLFQGGPGGRPGGGFDTEAMKKRQALQKEAIDAIQKLLNDDQKAALKDLKGEAFELARGGFGPGGPGGFGGPGGPGGGFGGPPQPGQIMPPFLADRLKLTDEQKKKLEELQKDVDGTLEKILTDEQKKQLKDMQQGGGRGPGGPGGRGGPGGGSPDR